MFMLFYEYSNVCRVEGRRIFETFFYAEKRMGDASFIDVIQFPQQSQMLIGLRQRPWHMLLLQRVLKRR